VLATKRLRDVLHRSKDATLAFTARVAINTKLRSIGQMTEFLIDTKNKRVRARVDLLGENEPIEVEILRYSLKEKGETTYITIEEAISSREWLTAALREFVVGQDLPIPAKAGAVLKLLT
jgi:environmental stress-induced protein Ves